MAKNKFYFLSLKLSLYRRAKNVQQLYKKLHSPLCLNFLTNWVQAKETVP